MFTLLTILTPHKILLNNNFMKVEMMKISLKEEGPKMFEFWREQEIFLLSTSSRKALG
jgi:hypothetical protein